MAPKARKSNKARRAGGAKKSVSIQMVREAVAALGDRNGSTIKEIFSYLVRTKKVSLSSRTLVILAIGRACREGSMAKKLPNTFVLKAGGKRKASPKRRKRRTKRARKSTAKTAGKRRRRRQRKRRNLKKKTKRSTKRRGRKTARKAPKKARKARSRRAKPKAYKRPGAQSIRRRPVRKAARRINYRE